MMIAEPPLAADERLRNDTRACLKHTVLPEADSGWQQPWAALKLHVKVFDLH